MLDKNALQAFVGAQVHEKDGFYILRMPTLVYDDDTSPGLVMTGNPSVRIERSSRPITMGASECSIIFRERFEKYKQKLEALGIKDVEMDVSEIPSPSAGVNKSVYVGGLKFPKNPVHEAFIKELAKSQMINFISAATRA